ncbi:MAG: hypothetical protein ACLR60_08580 [Clostridium paraputrificum]
MDILLESLRPWVLLLSFIIFVVTVIYLSWMMIGSMKENSNDDGCEVYNSRIVDKAIIALGNEKIEVEVDRCCIDVSTIEIQCKDGKSYLTDIKNVLLISE